MKNLMSLEELDTKLYETCLFLYEIVKFRYSHNEIINIKHKAENNLPDFESHCRHLQNNKYKKIYKIKIHNIAIGALYLHVDNVNSTFIIPHLLKKALKFLKENHIFYKKHQKISILTHELLFEKHKEIKTHFASINPKNTLSRDALLEFGYEPIETIFVAYTDNGKIKTPI